MLQMSNHRSRTFKKMVFWEVGIRKIRSRNIGWLRLMITIGDIGVYTPYYSNFLGLNGGGIRFEVWIVNVTYIDL